MLYALEKNILQFNVESEEELYLLQNLAESCSKTASVALRINPDIDAGSHNKISTGRKDDKFGIAFEEICSLYKKASFLPHIRITGLAMHIGSQITNLEVFSLAFKQLNNIIEILREENLCVKRIDLGGGMAVPYRNTDKNFPIEAYVHLVQECFPRFWEYEWVIEPGRLLVANSGVIVTEILYVKKTPSKNFLIADAGMNDFMRPSLYDAYHEICEITPSLLQEASCLYDIVGPVCETGDYFAKDRLFSSSLKSGDLLAIMSAGAYGAMLSSNYNARLRIPEIIVKNADYAITRARQRYENLLIQESFADFS